MVPPCLFHAFPQFPLLLFQSTFVPFDLFRFFYLFIAIYYHFIVSILNSTPCFYPNPRAALLPRPPSFPLSLFFTPYQAPPTPLDLSYPFVQLFLRDESLVLLLAFIRRFPGSARPPPLHHRFPRYVPRASALPLSSRSTPRCRVQAKKARFALSLELSASTEARTGEASGNERSCELRGGGFRERLFHPLPSHSYLSRYKQKRTTSPLFCECSTSSSESSSVEH